MWNFWKILTISLAAVLATAFAALPQSAAAQDIMQGLCSGANLRVDQPCNPVDDTEATQRVNAVITDVINIFTFVVGFVAVIMVIIGGLKYITSAGDSGNVTSAKNTILYAVVGLVVVALAQFIVRFVLTRVTTA